MQLNQTSIFEIKEKIIIANFNQIGNIQALGMLKSLDDIMESKQNESELWLLDTGISILYDQNGKDNQE